MQHELERGKVLLHIPDQHRRLQPQCQRRGQIQPQLGEQRTMKQHHIDGHGDAEECRIVFGQPREAEHQRPDVEIAICAAATRIAVAEKAQKEIQREQAAGQQHMVGQRISGEQPEDRRHQKQQQRHPEMRSPLGSTKQLRQQIDRPDIRQKAQRHRQPQRDHVPAEQRRRQPQQPGIERRMIVVGQRRMLPPHPIVGFVHEHAEPGQLHQLERDQQQGDDLHYPERNSPHNRRAGSHPVRSRLSRPGLMPCRAGAANPRTSSTPRMS